MKFELIDSHCHIHFRAYKDDTDEVIKRTLESGVAMITVGTQTKTSQDAIDVAERYDGIWATIGLHPNHLHKQEFEDTNELIKTRAEKFDREYYQKMVVHPKVVAVGEFGLDYFHLPPNVDHETMIEDQKMACREQLKFASEFNKPVIIHSRDAHADQYELLVDEIENGGLKKRGVIHSFTGTAAEAQTYIDLGFKIGINAIIFFSKELQAEVKGIPIESILIETDAPYLTPPPHRGKRNEPGYVKFVAEKLAEAKGEKFERVAQQTLKNTFEVFGLK